MVGILKEQLHVRQGLKKKIKKLVEFSTKGGGSAMGRFSTKKKRKKKKGFITLKII